MIMQNYSAEIKLKLQLVVKVLVHGVSDIIYFILIVGHTFAILLWNRVDQQDQVILNYYDFLFSNFLDILFKNKIIFTYFYHQLKQLNELNN
jgi:hypothetical protein